MESRGNENYNGADGQPLGTKLVSSTLHWGPAWNINKYELTHYEIQNPDGFHIGFHRYGLEWTPDYLRFTVDDNEVGTATPPAEGFWSWGQLDGSGFPNPWVSGTKMAPFDQDFYVIINLAVGGVAFFPDDATNGNGPKPWENDSGAASTEFWNGRNQWLPGWNLEGSDDAALQVDYVKIWAV